VVAIPEPRPNCTACRADFCASSIQFENLVNDKSCLLKETITSDLEPPRPLSIMARQMFDRHAARIHSEGRFKYVDHDQLCSYCECVELYLECKRAIDEHGVLVQGRTEKELVRNPALTPLNQARVALPVLAKAVPLVDPKPDRDGADIDAYIDELMAGE
jgi:phage terminase small subunit